MKHLLMLLCGVFTALTVSATGDSLSYLTPQDTVMLEIAPDQSKFTTHTFAPKQTMYSLSRFYAQDIDQIYGLNPQLTNRSPNIGEQVKIAVPNKTIKRFRDEDFDRNTYAPICYEVQKGETMYNVAKRVFRMPVDTLMSVNGLTTTILSPGQILQVGWMPIGGSADKITKRELSPLQRKSYANYKMHKAQSSNPKPIRGVASWTPGTGEASGSLFALYDGARPGTYLKVTNTANKKYAYVRVIGKPSHNSRKEQIDIQVSGTTARLLGVTKGNFYVIVE
ncbi:MAG: LysM peptidoglycan-binding domain-containing protein [Saprospiraceae bacterium]